MWGKTVATSLGEYIRELMRGRSYRDVATAIKDAGLKKVSRGTIQQIVAGETSAPSVETLESLALHFGATNQEQREIYAELMRLAGYLELMPDSHTLRTLQMRRANRDIEPELNGDDDDGEDDDEST